MFKSTNTQRNVSWNYNDNILYSLYLLNTNSILFQTWMKGVPVGILDTVHCHINKCYLCKIIKHLSEKLNRHELYKWGIQFQGVYHR